MRRALLARIAPILFLLPFGTSASSMSQAGGVSRGEIFAGFLAQHFAAHRDAAPDATYVAAWHDLNRDGQLEVLVYLNGPIWCGPHGCDLFIFTPTDTGWRQLAELSTGAPPIRVLERRSQGWNDLSLYVRSSLMPGEQMSLSFDGRTYGPEPRPLRRQDEGRELIGVDRQSEPLFAERTTRYR